MRTMILTDLFTWWKEQMRDLVPASASFIPGPELAPGAGRRDGNPGPLRHHPVPARPRRRDRTGPTRIDRHRLARRGGAPAASPSQGDGAAYPSRPAAGAGDRPPADRRAGSEAGGGVRNGPPDAVPRRAGVLDLPGRDARHRSPAAPCAPDPGSARAGGAGAGGAAAGRPRAAADRGRHRGRLPPGHPARRGRPGTLVAGASHRRLRTRRLRRAGGHGDRAALHPAIDRLVDSSTHGSTPCDRRRRRSRRCANRSPAARPPPMSWWRHASRSARRCNPSRC